MAAQLLLTMDADHVLQDEDSLRQDLQRLSQLLHPLALVGGRPGSGAGPPGHGGHGSQPANLLPTCHHYHEQLSQSQTEHLCAGLASNAVRR